MKTLHVGRPNIGNRKDLAARIEGMMDRNWLTNDGPLVREFEQAVSALIGAKHCIATCNATSALGILVRALGLTGEVIIPSWTFVATAHALAWNGLAPVFCDVNETHNLDPGLVQDLITSKTSAILGVHLWGRPCDVGSLGIIARNHGVELIFDAAHAFGCSMGGLMIGNCGRAEVFSFHATKFVNSFEGGMIATNDSDLARRIRLMRNFGYAGTGTDDVLELGINGKMAEACAAMGLTSLESMNAFIAVNRRNYERYQERLAGVPGIHLLEYDELEKCNYQYVVVEVDENRNGLLRILREQNIFARRYFYPGCHRSEPYRSKTHRPLPWTERLSERVLCLPTGTDVGIEDIERVCGSIECAMLTERTA